MIFTIKRRTAAVFGWMVFLTFLIGPSIQATTAWEKKLDEGKLRQGIALALSSGIVAGDIADFAIEENYPACEILTAMLKEKVTAYQALTALIKAKANLEHLAICCAEPGVDIPSAVFAKVALDAGLDDKTIDHLLRIAFTPMPEESGTFKRETVVAGGEIREGPFTSPFTFDSPFVTLFKQ